MLVEESSVRCEQVRDWVAMPGKSICRQIELNLEPLDIEEARRKDSEVDDGYRVHQYLQPCPQRSRAASAAVRRNVLAVHCRGGKASHGAFCIEGCNVQSKGMVQSIC